MSGGKNTGALTECLSQSERAGKERKSVTPRHLFPPQTPKCSSSWDLPKGRRTSHIQNNLPASVDSYGAIPSDQGKALSGDKEAEEKVEYEGLGMELS